MNPAYGIILWIVIGALAGWVASMIMGTNARQGALMNIIVGVVGALIGGFVTRALFHDDTSNNGIFASFGVALLGSVILLFVMKLVSGNRPIPH